MNDEKTPEAPQSHPTLDLAAQEIEAILRKHDLAGVAVIHTVGFRRVINILDPSYSCVFVGDDHRLKINKPIEDPAAPELASKKITDTINMVANMYATTSTLAQILNQVLVGVQLAFGMKPPPPPPRFNQVPPNFINGRKKR